MGAARHVPCRAGPREPWCHPEMLLSPLPLGPAAATAVARPRAACRRGAAGGRMRRGGLPVANDVKGCRRGERELWAWGLRACRSPYRGACSFFSSSYA